MPSKQVDPSILAALAAKERLKAPQEDPRTIMAVL